MKQPRVVILGGGFAGMLAAQRLRGLSASCLLVSESSAFVERVRFHEIAAGRPVVRHPIADLLAGGGVQHRQARVESVDLDKREVVTSGERIGYDHLFWALGSTVELDRVKGARNHAMSVATEAEAERLARRLGTLPAEARVVVCGGGLTAIELAGEIAEAFPRLRVALVTRGRLGPGLSSRGRAYVRESLLGLGVEITEDANLTRVGATTVHADGGREISFDCCVWAASFVPSELAARAGVAVRNGQILVDEHLRSLSHPEVFAAGDAAIPALEPGAPIRMGCATAMPMAAVASTNLRAVIEGRALVDFGFRYLAQFVSLGRHNCLAQITRGDDSPRSFILTGRFAMWLKELTFRYNLRGIRTGFYPFPARFLAPPRPALSSAAPPPRRLPR